MSFALILYIILLRKTPREVTDMLMGIDFGTCFSNVAVMRGREVVKSLRSDPGDTGLPTLFMYSRLSGKELYGYDCVNTKDAFVYSADVIRYMKRTIRKNPADIDKTVQSGGKTYTVREILKKYLKFLIDEGKASALSAGGISNPELEKITIAAPVGIASGQMTATGYNKLLSETVAEITGLSKENIFIIEEPVAASFSYINSEGVNERRKQSILVFDLGGGTLDVSVVQHDPNADTYKVMAKEGDLDLGGNDWDAELAKVLLENAGVSGAFTSKEDEIVFRSKVVPKIKKELSSDFDAYARFKFNGAAKDTDVTREEFEDATKHLLDRAVALTKKTIASYSPLGISAIDKIILVGGGSNMPQIRERLIKEFPSLGESGIYQHKPSLAIAMGAAIYSYIGKRVVNIASHTYGFDSRRSRDLKEMIYNVIYKGTVYDESGYITGTTDSYFHPRNNDQTRLTFEVYESDGKRGVGEDADWMEYGSERANGVSLTIDVPPKYLGKAKDFKVWVTFKLSSNGIFEILVKDEDGKVVGHRQKQI